MTASTSPRRLAAPARVFAVMEDYRQTEWSDLKVWFTSITEQFATIAINGPDAREILEPLVGGIDLSAAAFPHMSVREGLICGAPTRLARVSYTGELGFEVNVPADFGESVAEAIWAEGQKRGAALYGLETLHVLRAEKGFIVVGQETDGTVTPDDVGMGRMVALSKPDFIGKRSLALPDLKREGRKQLVGLLPVDPTFKLEEGAQIVAEAAPPIGNAGARPRHVLLYERDARPQLRARPRRGRPRAARSDAFRDDGRGNRSRSSSSNRSSTTRRASALPSDARAPARRAPLGSPRPRLARQRQGQGGRLALRDALHLARRAGRRRAASARPSARRRRRGRCARQAKERAPRCGWARTSGC